MWPLTAHWEEGQSPKSSLFLAGVGGCLAAPPCLHQGLNFALGLIKRRLGALAVEDRSLDGPLDDVRYLCEMCERREKYPAAEGSLENLPVREVSGGRPIQCGVIAQPQPGVSKVSVAVVGEIACEFPRLRLVLRGFGDVQAEAIEVCTAIGAVRKARPGADSVVLVRLRKVLLENTDLECTTIARHGRGPIAEEVYTSTSRRQRWIIDLPNMGEVSPCLQGRGSGRRVHGSYLTIVAEEASARLMRHSVEIEDIGETVVEGRREPFLLSPAIVSDREFGPDRCYILPGLREVFDRIKSSSLKPGGIDPEYVA